MQRVIEFSGPYAGLLREYVEMRQGLGFAMAEGSQRTLRHFAALLARSRPCPESSTRGEPRSFWRSALASRRTPALRDASSSASSAST